MWRILTLILWISTQTAFSADVSINLREYLTPTKLTKSQLYEFELRVFQSSNDDYKSRQQNARNEFEIRSLRDRPRIHDLSVHREFVKSRILALKSSGHTQGHLLNQEEQKLKQDEFALHFMRERLHKLEKAIDNLNRESRSTLSFSGVNVITLPSEVFENIKSGNTYFELIVKPTQLRWHHLSRKPIGETEELTLQINDLNQLLIKPLNRCSLF